MENLLNMNATPCYANFNNCGLVYSSAGQNSASFSAPHALNLYKLRSRNALVEEDQQQHQQEDEFHQQQNNFQRQSNNFQQQSSTKRERKTVTNRSRSLYNKRLLVNARERERMKTLNKGFENLRNALPCYIADGHISKITTLRLAINYIKTLSAVLKDPAASPETQALVEEQPLVLGQIPCSEKADVNHLAASEVSSAF